MKRKGGKEKVHKWDCIRHGCYNRGRQTINPKYLWSILFLFRFHSALFCDDCKLCKPQARRCLQTTHEHPCWDMKSLDCNVILSSAGTANKNLFKFHQLCLWMKDLLDSLYISGFYPIIQLKPIIIIIIITETQISNIINSLHLWCFYWDQMHDSLSVMAIEDTDISLLVCLGMDLSLIAQSNGKDWSLSLLEIWDYFQFSSTQLEKVRKQSLNIKISAQIKPTNDTYFGTL